MIDHIAYNIEYMKFRQTRDFGQLLLAPFSFIKQEFKRLSKALLYYAGPFLVISLTLIGFFIKMITEKASFDDESFVISTFIYAGSFLLFMLFAFSMANVVIHSYVALYVEKGRDGFDLDDVWSMSKKNFFSFLGQQFVLGLLIMVGLMFCYIPGIYLQVSTSFVYIASIHENKSFGKSLTRSFQVIKGEWWTTFALTMVMGIILSIVSYILIIPIYAIIFVGAATGTQGAGMFIAGGVFVVLYFILYLFMYAVQVLMSNFQYFNLIEMKESPGLLKKVREIKVEGEDDDKTFYGNENNFKTNSETYNENQYRQPVKPNNEDITKDEPKKKKSENDADFDRFDFSENDNRFID